MQVLVSVIDDKTNSGTAEEQAAIDVFNDRLVAEGHWVFAGGLAAPGSATVFDNRDGKGLATDGPFVETKEHCAGFWVLDVPSLELARELAAAGSLACNRRVELRAFLSPPDVSAG